MPNTRTPQPITIRTLTNLVAEAEAAGLDTIPVADLKAALAKQAAQ